MASFPISFGLSHSQKSGSHKKTTHLIKAEKIGYGKKIQWPTEYQHTKKCTLDLQNHSDQ